MRKCDHCDLRMPVEHFYAIDDRGHGAICKVCMAKLAGNSTNVCAPVSVKVSSLVKAFEEVNRYFQRH